MVSRLHLEVGHSDARGMIDLLRRKHAHRLIIATANKFSCCVCEESQRRRLHPMLNLHVLGTIMVGAGSRASSVLIRRVMDTEQGLGNVTGEITLNKSQNPSIIRTDPEGAFRDQGFRRGLPAKSIRLDIAP